MLEKVDVGDGGNTERKKKENKVVGQQLEEGELESASVICFSPSPLLLLRTAILWRRRLSAIVGEERKRLHYLENRKRQI